MCVVSLVTEHYIDRWGPRIDPNWPGYPSAPWPHVPYAPTPADTTTGIITIVTEPKITQEEVNEFRRLLERAREYDARNNEPDCELSEKRDLIKKIAAALGVEINFL